MKIVIDIPDDEIPKKQEYMEICLHFIDGTVCECTYPFLVLPKGHGDLIDRNVAYDVLDNADLSLNCSGLLKYILTVIPADK